jgi:Thiamine monophosphate kinase
MLNQRADAAGPTLADIGEDELLSAIFPLLPGGPGVLIGPGDDTALLSAPGGSVLATTDAMVRGRDWLDEWSSGADVGAKIVAQNLADIAAMGGVPTGLLVTLIADPRTSLAWVRDFTEGLAQAAAQLACRWLVVISPPRLRGFSWCRRRPWGTVKVVSRYAVPVRGWATSLPCVAAWATPPPACCSCSVERPGEHRSW